MTEVTQSKGAEGAVDAETLKDPDYCPPLK